MSTAQLYLMSDSTTQPNFQAWAQAISVQLDTAGWTKTADTGQVNWASNPAVPAANAWTLYEIRQPASDPLQTGATAYYIRIDYGLQNSGGCNLRVTLGTGTNGAGTLTGFVTTPAPGGNSATGTGSVTWECDFSWDASRMGILLWRNNYANYHNPAFIAIERTKAANGSDNSDGVTLVYATGGSTNQFFWQQTIVFGIGLPPSFNSQGFLLCSPNFGNGTSLNFNNSVPLSPIFPCYGKWGNPMTVMAVAQYADTIDGAFMTTTLYGATRTYLMTKAIAMQQGQCYMFMRYD